MTEPTLIGRDDAAEQRRHAAVLHARLTGGDEDSIPPTPEQYHAQLLDEARRIAKGHSCLQPDREHLEALIEQNDWLKGEVTRLKLVLTETRDRAARLKIALKDTNICLNGRHATTNNSSGGQAETPRNSPSGSWTGLLSWVRRWRSPRG